MNSRKQHSTFRAHLLLRIIQTTICIAGISSICLFSSRLEQIIFGAQSGGGFTYKRIPEFLKLKEAPDLLLLGSSTCSYSFHRETFRKSGFPRAFNLSSNGQTLAVSEILLKLAVQRDMTPKAVIVDINPRFWNKGDTESLLVLAGNSNSLTPKSLFWEFIRFNQPYLTLSALYFTAKTALGLAPNYSEEIREWEYEGAGFRFYPMPANMHMNYCLEPYSMTKNNLTALTSIQNVCRENNIPLILTTPPRNPNCRPEIPNIPIIQAESIITGDNWPNSTIDTMYCDAIHLRGVASANYSKWFIHKLDQALSSIQ